MSESEIVLGRKRAATFGRLSWLVQEFDSVEVHHFSSNDCGDADRLLLPRRTEDDFDLVAQGNIGGGEHVHAVLAQVQGGALDVRFGRDDADRQSDPLTR